MYGPLLCVQFLTILQACFIPIWLQNEIQVSLTIHRGYVPENCREWQNRKRLDVSLMRIVGLRS